jgi:hypothetical protein
MDRLINLHRVTLRVSWRNFTRWRIFLKRCRRAEEKEEKNKILGLWN